MRSEEEPDRRSVALPATDQRRRLWQIDFVRGLAVLSMVYYHFMWDMHFFGLYPTDVTVGGWNLFARGIATTFLLLVGVSVVLSVERKSAAVRDRLWLVRGLKVLGWGVVITMVTRLFLGDAFVLYGILHLIGTAFLLAPLLWRIRRVAPLLGVLFVTVGFILAIRSGELSWMLPYGIPLGVRPVSYEAVDYFPVFPWLGVVMIGMGIGQWLRPIFARMQNDRPAPPVLAQIATVGRHTLLIYIVHQPVMLAGFSALGYTVW